MTQYKVYNIQNTAKSLKSRKYLIYTAIEACNHANYSHVCCYMNIFTERNARQSIPNWNRSDLPRISARVRMNRHFAVDGESW